MRASDGSHDEENRLWWRGRRDCRECISVRIVGPETNQRANVAATVAGTSSRQPALDLDG